MKLDLKNFTSLVLGFVLGALYDTLPISPQHKMFMLGTLGALYLLVMLCHLLFSRETL